MNGETLEAPLSCRLDAITCVGCRLANVRTDSGAIEVTGK